MPEYAKHFRRYEMITIRPGSHVHTLLTVLSFVGEYTDISYVPQRAKKSALLEVRQRAEN